jgi:tRNA pseudouridine55 synthase
MEKFKGEISQVPPMYSAKKIGGTRLYEIARKGGEVERQPKKVFVHSLELDSFEGESGVFTAVVSQGTYIRTLCEDLGRLMESAAHMGALVREGVHIFTAEGSWTLGRLEERKAFPEEWLLPLDYPLGLLPKYTAAPLEVKSLLNGRFIFYTGADSGPIRLYSQEGGFLGIGNADPITKKISPEKVIPNTR